MEIKPVEKSPVQPAFSDFGFYKCFSCGRRVMMGFDQGKQGKEVHAGKGVEWEDGMKGIPMGCQLIIMTWLFLLINRNWEYSKVPSIRKIDGQPYSL